MAFVHSYFFGSNLFGFALLIMVWILFRGILLRWRTSSMERMRLSMSKPMPVSAAQVQMQGRVACPRCSAAVPAVARFCPHCGLSLHTLPAPIPLAYSPYTRRRRGPVLLIILLLAVIGFFAYQFWQSRDDDSAYQSETKAPVQSPPVRYYYKDHR